MKYCSNCKCKMPDFAEFCGMCGAPIKQDDTPPDLQHTFQQTTESQQPYTPPQPYYPRQSPQPQDKKGWIKVVVIVGAALGLLIVAGIIIIVVNLLSDDLSPVSPPLITSEPPPSTVPEDPPASAPASTPVQPDFSNYRRTVTLGDCNLYHIDFPDNMRGWISKNSYGLASSWEISDFTGSRYLIIELEAAPRGGLVIALNGDGTGYSWAESQLVPDSGSDQTVFIVDLTKMNGYDNFRASKEVAEIWLCYWSNSWSDLPVKDVYFATDTATQSSTTADPPSAPSLAYAGHEIVGAWIYETEKYYYECVFNEEGRYYEVYWDYDDIVSIFEGVYEVDGGYLGLRPVARYNNFNGISPTDTSDIEFHYIYSVVGDTLYLTYDIGEPPDLYHKGTPSGKWSFN